MRVFIEQTFPLGRFHATPWKVFPYDDPHGEWPPSPWRLLRAVIARSYQLDRETGTPNDEGRTQLVRAFAASSIAWRLPEFTWRGPGLRQYQPAEFKRVPESAQKPGIMTYKTTKVQDNFWLISPECAPIMWILESNEWPQSARNLLADCLDRMTYFGRAESITEIRRVDALPPNVAINCVLEGTPSSGSVPVLAPTRDATLEQVQALTDDPSVAKSTVPPGAQWLFAQRPVRPPVKLPRRKRKSRESVSFVQFAVGARVSPPRKSIVVLTQRFRGRVIREFLGCGRSQASAAQKDKARLLMGKDADGKPLQEHHPHAYFGIHFDERTGRAARLMVWRSQPFTDDEQQAILKAADRELPIAFGGAGRKNPWAVRLVPLDSQEPHPRGFDAQAHRRWETATPYVPPRHVFDRQGRIKPGESPEAQLQQELDRRGFDTSRLAIAIDSHEWTQVHRPPQVRGEPSNSDKRGYRVSLTFDAPVTGPIALGHSAHFGLGLFVPA